MSEADVFTLENGEEDSSDDLVADSESMRQTKKKRGRSGGGFQGMGLSNNVIRAVFRQGFRLPTPIQRRSIPLALNGRDVAAMARTGSGKTAAFAIPLIERLRAHSPQAKIRAIVLAPTRELAEQTHKVICSLSALTDLRTVLIIGGERLEAQFASLSKSPDIVIATPGRLLHIFEEVQCSLRSVEIIVYDEADRLFEMGFLPQLQALIEKLPESRQSLMFSATMPKSVTDFARARLKDAELVRLDTESKLSADLKTVFLACREEEKLGVLLFLLRGYFRSGQQCLVFAASRHHVELIREFLAVAGIEACMAYGSMDQSARRIHVSRFRKGEVGIMVVTDVAARGIDIPLLDSVINFSFPPSTKIFVHRAGRVARMGRPGVAYSLVEPSELPYLVELYLFLGRPIETATKYAEGDARASLDADEEYGAIPQGIVDDYVEQAQRLFGERAELAALKKVATNAQKQYVRTRPAAAPESVRRAKAIDWCRMHPMFADASVKDDSVHNFLAKLRSFSPSQVALELHGGSEIAAVMSKRRESMKALVRQPVGILSGDFENPSRKRKRAELEVSESGNFAVRSVPASSREDDVYSISSSKWKSAELQVDPDDEEGLQRLRNLRRWDKQKKKFVKLDLSKAMRNESGARIREKADGRRYADWKRKSGVHDAEDGREETPISVSSGIKNARPKRGTQRGAKSELRRPEQIRKIMKNSATRKEGLQKKWKGSHPPRKRRKNK